MEYKNLAQKYHKIYKDSLIVAEQIGEAMTLHARLLVDIAELGDKLNKAEQKKKELKDGRKT